MTPPHISALNIVEGELAIAFHYFDYLEREILDLSGADVVPGQWQSHDPRIHGVDVEVVDLLSDLVHEDFHKAARIVLPLQISDLVWLSVLYH